MQTLTHNTASQVSSGEVRTLWVYTDTVNTLEYAGELKLEGQTLTIWFSDGAFPEYYRGTFSDKGALLGGTCHYR